MTDLDSTEILSADESITENTPMNDMKASLQIVSGTDPNTFEITKETIIGRSSPSDLIIAAPSLSKQHAKISINNGQYFITDLGSSNKTFHNKVQLQPNVCYALHNEDEIKFGDIICSFQEEKQINTTTETKINPNPSTQTITNSYDDQEPTQPIKVWNPSSDANNSTNVTPKQNGINDSPNKSSSSFVSHQPPPSSTINDDDDDDDNLIIGSTPVSLVVESKELKNDDQLEIDPAPTQINKGIDDTSPSVNNEQMITENSKVIEDDENITDNTTDQEISKEPPVEEQMDTDQINESPSMVIDEKQSDNLNEMEEVEEVVPIGNTEVMTVDETNTEVPPTTMEQETAANVDKTLPEPEKMIEEPIAANIPEEEPATTAYIVEEPSSTADVEEEPSSTADVEEETAETADVEETEESAGVSTRGVARRNVRRARGRRGVAGTTRARVVSTRIHGGRRQPIVPPKVIAEENNITLEETVSTETEESPKKLTRTSNIKEKKSTVTPKQEPTQESTASNVRISARIKERASSGRNRQFPYADDYVDLDDVEKQSKTNKTPTTARKSNPGRPSASPSKRINLRQQPIDASANSEQKDNTNVYEDIDAVAENKEPTPKSSGRKRKSTTPVSTNASKRSRPITPQTVPTMNTRRKQTSTIEQSPTVTKPGRRTTGGQQPATAIAVAAAPVATTTTTTTTTATVTPKRGRKSTKLATPTEKSPEKQSTASDRPVRIALSSHLNFDQNHIDTLRKLGFEIMDETCPVDALVVDRIRRTKKFFMCLARGAHILSPSWIETMIKENRYIPYEKYYLEDTNAETRYGFQLRESVRLAKQGPIFKDQKFFCTKDTSPPYDDLKDIIEAAGGKLIEKINVNKPGKEIICIVGQIHKNEYEDLFKKGVPIVSEEFILSGISKQKLDFDAFSLFQNVTTNKSK